MLDRGEIKVLAADFADTENEALARAEQMT